MNRSEVRDIQTALERLFSGDMSVEAGCLADQLEDLGYDGLRLRRLVRPEPSLFDEASTSGLPKMRSPG